MKDYTFMKTRPILPLVISMSLPMVISMLVNSLYNIVDSYFVAKISEDAMTALSLVFPVQNFINAVAIGFGVGLNAVISFHLGANQNDKANEAASIGFVLCIIHGIILTIACTAIMPHFLATYTSSKNVINLGIQYCRIVFAFNIIMSMGLAFEKIFQALGNMKVSMFALAGGCLANIILDPIMIFAMNMDIKGAALATGLGQTLSLAVYLIIYFFKPISVKIKPRYFSFNFKIIGKLYSIGIPAILNLALPSVLISSLNAILASFSQAYVLILGIYYKLQTFLYLTANGIVQGIRPLVGYNYGAKEYKRVNSIYKTALTMTACIMLLGTILCLAIPDRLIAMFTDNSQTIELGKTALRIISAGFVVSAVSVTSSGALEGLSKGLPSLIISLLRYTVIIIPVAFILSKLFSADGVWHAFWIAEFITAIAAFFIYRKSVKSTMKQ